MGKEIIVRLASPERYYEKCYHDFMDCKLLNGEEKIVYLALKRFLDVRSDHGNVFPAIETIQEITGWGNQKVIKYIKSLVRKGVVKKIRQGLSKPNIYILEDYPTMWTCDSIEDMAVVMQNGGIKPLTPEQHIAELERMGYIVDVKEKELVGEPTKAHSQAPINNSLSMDKDSTGTAESQAERYTMQDIKLLYDYSILAAEYPERKEDIEIVFGILYDTLNSTKPTVRIGGEDKPTMVVIGKLMKLYKESIIYAMDKFSEQTERIKNPTAYMLTILYNAPEQFKLDIQNQVSHDMAHWNDRCRSKLEDELDEQNDGM